MEADEIKVIISNPDHKKLADFVGDSGQIITRAKYKKNPGNSTKFGREIESTWKESVYPDYSQDWNGLMRVVEKIINQDFSYNLEDSRSAKAVCWFIKHYTDGTKWECVESEEEAITAVYQAVLKVIEHLEG